MSKVKIITPQLFFQNLDQIALAGYQQIIYLFNIKMKLLPLLLFYTIYFNYIVYDFSSYLSSLSLPNVFITILNN